MVEGKNKAAQALAKLRAKSLSPERRRAIASLAAKTRWARGKEGEEKP